jgi:peptidoglycan/xylan/chitin deacetylase (PgdA/CDA1 family)
MKTALLSFDVEEFDMPFEYGGKPEMQEQIATSYQGLQSITSVLEKYNATATFYCTGVYALAKTEQIRDLSQKHEIASHNHYHSSHKKEDLSTSKAILENITQQEVVGFRMPRMHPVDEKEIFKAGYIYNSSINPTFLPGRYNNLDKPRTYFMQDGVLQIPASVSPLVRFPLFWLSFHNLPLKIYTWLAKITHKKDKYLNLYFHPWEFTDLTDKERFGFPNYVSKNSGNQMIQRMDTFIGNLKRENYSFCTISNFVEKI